MQNDKIRLGYLDAIRGIAALMVVFSHYAERTPLHNFWLFEFFTPGQFGVVVFFMLSGFVIPYSFQHSKGNVVGFITSRFFRLYPAYWLSVLLASISAIMFLNSPFSTSMIMANLTMIQKLLGYPDAFGTYWTLLVELIFYALCVFLAIFGVLSNIKIKFYLSVIFLMLGIVTSIIRKFYNISIPVGVIVSLSMMLFGSLWREFIVSEDDTAIKYSLSWCALFAVAFPVISFFAYNFDRGLGENAINYSISFILGVIAFIILTTVLKIHGKFFLYLGTISYSVYLLHPFVLEFINSKVVLSDGFHVKAFMMYILLVIVLASLSYHLIEKPSVALGKRLRDRLLQN